MKPCLYLLFLITPFLSIAQDKNVIKEQALIVARATKTQDYATVVKYTHPSLIKMVGGNDAMMKLLTSTMKTCTLFNMVLYLYTLVKENVRLP